MKHTFHILITYFLLAAFSLKAQTNCTYTFKGSIADAKTNAAVEATIILLVLQKNAIAQSNGTFSIDSICSGKLNFFIEYLGYEIYEGEVEIPQQKPLKILLVSKTTNLKTVVIEEHKREEIGALNKTTINSIELSKVQGNSIADVLKNITGVNILYTGNSIAKPVIHGMHSNRILMLNNGIRQEGQNWGSEHAPEIDPYIATNVSVVKGANAVRYGSDAIAGVILVEPKKLIDIKKIGGEINVAANTNGKGGATSGILEFSRKADSPLKARIQGTLRKFGNTNTPNYIMNNTGMEEKNYSGSVGYVKENYGAEFYTSSFKTEIALFRGSHIGNLTDLDKAFANTTPRPEFIDTFSYTISRPKQLISHQLYKFNSYYYNQRFGKFNFVYAHQNNNRQEFDAHMPRGTYGSASNKPELDFTLSTQTADFVWEHNTKKGFSGSAGASGMWQSNSYMGRNLIPNFLMHSYGAFFIEHYVKNKIEFEFGARFDARQMNVVKRNRNNQLYQPQFTYKVPSATFGVVFSATKFILKGYVGTAFRAPAISELFINGVHHGSARFEIGDEKLKPEKAFNSSVNFIYTASQKINFQVEAYNNYIVDYIFLLPIKPPVLTVLGAFPTFAYKQTTANLSGLDAEINYTISKIFALKSRTSILFARNVKQHNWIELMPANSWGNTLKITLPKNIFAEASAIYTARQTRTNANVDYAVPPADYLLFDCNILKTFETKKTKLTTIIGCNNLLNKVYRNYMNSFRYYADDLGRNIYLKIKLTF